MFKDALKIYGSTNLVIFPCGKNKRPFVKGLNWNSDNYDPFDFENCNAPSTGLRLGDDIVVLDLDFTDDEQKKKVQLIVEKYPTPCTRQGNKDRLPSRFYSSPSFNFFTKKKFSKIEILDSGRYCVIPPSVHEDGIDRMYKWKGIPLDQCYEDLPPFPEELYIELLNAFGSNPVGVDSNSIEVTKSDGSRCNHGSHNYLSRVLIACIESGKGTDETVEELLERDSEINEKVSYFLCPSRSEWRGCPDKRINAMAFVMDAYKRHGAPTPNSAAIRIGEIITKKRERVKFPKFRGVAQECFEYIYQNSEVPRTRMTIASTISLMSTILGNKVNLGGRTYTNTYNLMVLRSGGGKNFPLNFPKNFLASNPNTRGLVGQSQPASDTGLTKTLTKNPVRIDTIDEASKMFMGHKNPGQNAHMQKVIEAYTELYSSPGHYFSGKVLASADKKVGECYSPCITMLAATTPDGFQQTFNKSLVTKGMGARIFYWFDDKEKMPKFQLGSNTNRKYPRSLINFTHLWTKRNPKNEQEASIELEVSPEALKALEHSHKIFAELQMKSHDNVMLSIYARAYEQMCKLVMIDACCSQFNGHTWTIPVVKVDNVEWAARFMASYIKMMGDFIENYLPDDFENKHMVKIANLIRSCQDKGITKSELTRKIAFYGDKNYRKKLIDSLVESETVKEVKDGSASRYFHSNFIA